MLAYKILGPDWTCKDHTYVDGTNRYKGALVMRKSGFHASLKPMGCLMHYNYSPANIYIAVEIVGDYEVDDDTVVTNAFKVVKIIPYEEFGKLCTGVYKNRFVYCTFHMGIFHGSYKGIHPNGSIWVMSEYQNGKLISEKRYNDKGECVSTK